MTLIGCFVAPHPPIVVPEVGGAQLAEAEATVRSMRLAQQRTAELDPDTIVLLSPHAPIMARQMGVSMASSYRGSLMFFRAPDVRVVADGDQRVAEAIMERTAENGVPTAITASHGEVMELDHGAMVPLVYMVGGLPKTPKLVLLAFSQLSFEDHVRFGKSVGEAILQVPQRVVYVASSDLSHRLIPGAPAGFDPRGARFDNLVAEKFGAGDWKGLVSIDRELIIAAGECGYRSLLVLAGVVAAANAAGLNMQNHLFSYEGPFGVGYLVGEVEVTGAPVTQGAAS